MTEKPKRRWFQFSLRTLLVFVLLVSIGMSWLGVKLERARRQREAVRVIEKAGGEVFYDYQSEDILAQPSVPKWVCVLVGDHFLFDVVSVVRCGEGFGDEEMILMKHLKGLTTLDTAGQTGLRITDTGLKHLEGLADLTHLDLSETEITDAGLEHLKGLTNLAGLSLGSTRITDSGLQHLKRLANLTVLNLRRTEITDAGLEHLEGLSNLETLSLAHTQVTDARLEHFNGLTCLDFLNLTGTQVTPEGVKKLQEALPDCEIIY